VGQVLTGNRGSSCVGLIPGSTVTLKWFRCDDVNGTVCESSPVATTTASTLPYELVPADRGNYLKLEQTAAEPDPPGPVQPPPDDVDVAMTGLVQGRPPNASFVFSPSPATAGQRVTFTSTSRDPDGDPLTLSWDLDNDGQFDDAAGGLVHTTFSEAGSYFVTLRVSADGDVRTVFRTVVVNPVPRRAPRRPSAGRGPELLSPFPVVIIAGRATAGGARLTQLTVRAPRGSRIRVLCRGRGRSCPRRVSRKRVGRRRRANLRSFRRRMRAGTVIAVYVRKTGFIGKYTRFRIRRRRAPARIDRCLVPGRRRPTRCPGS
jgi:hypothetical protein